MYRFCGRPTEILLAGAPICEQCYENAGSCCPEFGSSDLWAEREHESAAVRPPADPLTGASAAAEPAT